MFSMPFSVAHLNVQSTNILDKKYSYVVSILMKALKIHIFKLNCYWTLKLMKTYVIYKICFIIYKNMPSF